MFLPPSDPGADRPSRLSMHRSGVHRQMTLQQLVQRESIAAYLIPSFDVIAREVAGEHLACR
jgi:hypothetical protein